jgi:hypothetical protein
VALTISPKSSLASHSETELKPQTQTRSPHDRQASNTRFDNKSEQQSYVGEDILFGNLSLGGEQQELPKQNWSKQK